MNRLIIIGLCLFCWPFGLMAGLITHKKIKERDYATIICTIVVISMLSGICLIAKSGGINV